MFCRDNQDECLQYVLEDGPTLGEGHQRWQLNEINALIWPNAERIGVMDAAAFDRTAEIAKQFGVIKADASPDSYRTRPRRGSVSSSRTTDVDVTGESWKKETVEVTPGGE